MIHPVGDVLAGLFLMGHLHPEKDRFGEFEMAGIQNYWEFVDDFIGGGIFGASATAFDPWVITDTSSAGTPTYVRVDLGETSGAFAPGVAKLTFDSTSEVQNVCLSFGDKLAFDINSLRGFESRVRLVPG